MKIGFKGTNPDFPKVIWLAFAAIAGAAGCGPVSRIPNPVPVLAGTLPAADSAAQFARALAPVLYLHPDEWFRLERAVAVIHPTLRIIAYHLLWTDDAHGAWVPFTNPTDQEIVWVAYDSTGAPSEVITYWHGSTLRADWRRKGFAAVDVQWGKHGSLPRGVMLGQLPAGQSMNLFYLYTWLGIPDFMLGAMQRPGPLCFCAGFERYRRHTREVPLAGRIDVVARTEEPDRILAAVFGVPYSRKPPWPPHVAARSDVRP